MKKGKNSPVGAFTGDAWPHVLGMLDLGSICRLRQTSRRQKSDADAALLRLRSLCFGRAAKKIGDQSVVVLSASSSATLVTVNLSSCKLLTDQGLHSLNECSLLQSLSLMGCKQISNQGLSRLFGGHLKELKSLNLNGCRRIGKAGIVSVAQSRQLTRLDLTGCSVTTTDHALQALGTGCPQLRLLGLGGLKRLTDTGLLEIARGCTELRHLCLAGCERIRLCFLPARGASFMQQPAWQQQQQQQQQQLNPEMNRSYWPQLTCLDLGLGERRWPSPGRLCSLASARALRDLDISGCDKVTDSDVAELILPHIAPDLEATMNALPATITSTGDYSTPLQPFVPPLESFTARACSLGDSFLATVAASAQNLCELDMSSCFEVTDAGVTRALGCCQQLRSLRLDSCWLLTDLTVCNIIALRSPTAISLNQSCTDAYSCTHGGGARGGGSGVALHRSARSGRQLRFVSLVDCHLLAKSAWRKFRFEEVAPCEPAAVKIHGERESAASEPAGLCVAGQVRLFWSASRNRAGRFMLSRDDLITTALTAKESEKKAVGLGNDTGASSSGIGRVKSEDKDAIKVGGPMCSAWRTGQTHAKQDVYHCYTCGLVGGSGCCRACTLSCHRGHEVEWSHHGKFYCDCFYRSCCKSGAWN
jgi:hypothetical protein